MLSNYFKIAWRSLWKNKLFSLINISGLSIGIASSLLLLSYAAFQFSYDDFHANKENIYRVNLSFYQDNKLVFQSAENYAPLANALKNNFPEVADAARLYNMGYKNNCVFTYQGEHFKETKFLYADASFLNIFSFPFIQGNPKTALSEPFTAVISASTAKKIFGDADPIGKSIQMTDDDRNSELCKITGVFKDVPDNSHIKFNVLISYATLDTRSNGIDRYEKGWDYRKDYYTYILLRPDANAKSFQDKLSLFISKYGPEDKTNHSLNKLSLEPLDKIHLTSGLIDEPEPTANEKAISFLIIVAVFIVGIAWVNYINLSTASSVSRAKEIGIRKVLGSRRHQLIKQFLTEALSINMVSVVLAVVCIQLFQSLLKHFFAVDFSIANLFSNKYGILFMSFMLLGAFFSGLYPAFILSSFKPVSVLKGKIKSSKTGISLRKSLVILQFTLSILLIIGTLVVYQQVHFMLNDDLGMKPEQVIVLDRPGRWDASRAMHSLYVERFKEIALKNPQVVSVGMSDELPGKQIRYPSSYVVSSESNIHSTPINTTGVDENYFQTLGMKFLAGRNFSKEYKTDDHSLVITESAAKLLGFRKNEDAIGKDVLGDNTHYTIIGIIKDFHQLSLEKKMEPSAFQFIGNDPREFEYYLVKIKTEKTEQSIAAVQAAWNENFKENPFSFSFLDEFFNSQYKSEIQFEIMFFVFSVIAIAIACIGLFALVAFMISQRTKEIGVRKILGAGINDVFLLLTKDFVKLILFANIVAWPLGWLVMSNWLKDFPYRIHISLLVFLAAGTFALIIAMATISLQAIKASLANPVKSLRTE